MFKMIINNDQEQWRQKLVHIHKMSINCKVAVKLLPKQKVN